MLGVFTLWPFVNLLVTVVDRDTVADTVRIAGLGRIIAYTTAQATVSTVATLALGVVPAYLVHRYRFPGRAAVRAVLTVPFFLPTVVVAAAFRALLPVSLHDTPTAVVLAHVFLNVAVVVQVVGAMWDVLPTDLTGAARTLGAGPVAVARHVVWPVLRPGIASAAAVVFAFSFTSFGAAKLLGGPANPTLEVEIVRRTTLGDVDGAVVLAVAQIVLLALMLLGTTWLQRRTRLALRGDARPRHRSWSQRVPWVAGGFAVLFACPLVTLAIRSLHGRNGWTLAGWTRFGTGERRGPLTGGLEVWPVIGMSLRFAVISAVLACAVGVLASVAIAHARRYGWLLDAGLAVPIATSAVTIGLGMLITFDRAPFDWRGSWWLIPIGHTLIAVPFAVRSLLGALRAIPDDQRDAAATLGASPRRAVWEIDGRALRRPLMVVFGLTATISLGEFGATTVLTRAGTDTLPLAIGRLLGRVGDLPRLQAYALATLLGVLCATIVAVADVAHQRGTEEVR